MKSIEYRVGESTSDEALLYGHVKRMSGGTS